MLENRQTTGANVDKKDCTEGHPQHSPLFINFFWGRAELFAGGDHFVNPTQQFCLLAVVQRAADKQETAQRDDLHADQIGSGGADCLRNLVRISLLAVHQQGDILRLRFIEPAAKRRRSSGISDLAEIARITIRSLSQGYSGGNFPLTALTGRSYFSLTALAN